jgi:hypothetical protein
VPAAQSGTVNDLNDPRRLIGNLIGNLMRLGTIESLDRANLAQSVGREHDAVVTIKRGCLIFAPIGAGITATGLPLPSVTTRRRDGDH